MSKKIACEKDIDDICKNLAVILDTTIVHFILSDSGLQITVDLETVLKDFLSNVKKSLKQQIQLSVSSDNAKKDVEKWLKDIKDTDISWEDIRREVEYQIKNAQEKSFTS